MVAETENSTKIQKYTTNLTKVIAANPDNFVISGREAETNETLVALSRNIKNSPLLIGEPGVGKTAIVEGLAKLILEKQVPSRFYGFEVIELHIGAMIGDHFTQELTLLLEELKRTPNIIVFIDEIHTLVGAGDSHGTMDASNIMKPALARGDFPVIGATTNDEYFDYIAPDGALSRRFIPIRVDEPARGAAINILSRLAKKFEDTNSVTITQDAVSEAVDGSVRYLPSRFLPDKAIDLLDSASARATFTESKTVTSQSIVEEIEAQTGIPASSIVKTNVDKIADLRKQLNQGVIGQPRAINSVIRAIKRNVARLNSKNKPISSMLFLGPTGVGKTETIKVLVKAFFDTTDNLIRLDMSEYKPEGSENRFIEQLTKEISQRPYAVLQFDEIEKANSNVFDLMLQILDEGQLTNKRGKTFSFRNTIIIATSNLGYELLTDNRSLLGETRGEYTSKDADFEQLVKQALSNKFRPEFINRWNEIVVFNFLGYQQVVKIADLRLKQLKASFMAEHPGINLEIASNIGKYIANVGFDDQNGARPINRQIELKLIDPISDWVIQESSKFDHIQGLRIVLKGDAPATDGYDAFDNRHVQLSTIYTS